MNIKPRMKPNQFFKLIIKIITKLSGEIKTRSTSVENLCRIQIMFPWLVLYHIEIVLNDKILIFNFCPCIERMKILPLLFLNSENYSMEKLGVCARNRIVTFLISWWWWV